MDTVVDARKEKIPSDKAFDLLQSVSLVVAARGKKVVEFNLPVVDSEIFLKAVMGPSGNLRAPTLRFGDICIVGFNLDVYERFFAGMV